MSGEEGVLFIIFGATGDLAQRELVPEIATLGRKGALGRKFRLLGVARSDDMNDAIFRRRTKEALAAADPEGDSLAAWCSECVHYQRVARPEHYAELKERILAIEREAALPGHRVFYLSIPPQSFSAAVRGLGEIGLNRSEGWTRLVIEKPFGRDLESARKLNETVHEHFDESQVYRIDHFIGKETVQNLLVFRFANTIFESVWHRDRIDHVQITVAEPFGIRERGAFYEQTGCLRDMVQNHLTQLLAHIAMEVPLSYDAESVRFEKIKVVRAIAPIRAGDAVYGQYGTGTVDGEKARAYREEDDVAADSVVETFVALKLHVNNWRWQGVPFYLRTGKRLARKVTEIVVSFRRPPVHLFESLHCSIVPPNRLHLRLQPDEGFALYFDVKKPGEPIELRNQPLHFHYREAFGELPGAYETLLQDVLEGNQTLFVHANEVEAAWRVYAPLLEDPPVTRRYAAGTWGPAAAEALLRTSGHAWVNPEGRLDLSKL